MPKKSAGILLYRVKEEGPQVFLVHPGGPFWARKDIGVWSIPKGEFEDDEDPLTAAIREMQEETGIKVNEPFIELNPAKLKSGKIIYAWAAKGDVDPENIVSNTFEMEWPPRSGKKQSFAEVDRADWFTIEEGKNKIISGQVSLLEQLQQILKDSGS
jgi:predicted NUDIX family NTP pyrophosphohydrolase